MNLATHRKLLTRPWNTLGHLEPIKAIGLLVVAIVPGGLVIPVCYAAYVAIRKARPGQSTRH